ncbi:hypothetical protein WN51_08374 [Melipona quadrifasciata]|uniref:Uncharacterized protein n=1 Tax=Melipona quadrifasciata TaxID=166423 RepID=A0A0M9A9W6_9HYME|nr:hypothetical protein WN51_08374 [Melipona quadrifasciata]
MLQEPNFLENILTHFKEQWIQCTACYEWAHVIRTSVEEDDSFVLLIKIYSEVVEAVGCQDDDEEDEDVDDDEDEDEDDDDDDEDDDDLADDLTSLLDGGCLVSTRGGGGLTGLLVGSSLDQSSRDWFLGGGGGFPGLTATHRDQRFTRLVCKPLCELGTRKMLPTSDLSVSAVLDLEKLNPLTKPFTFLSLGLFAVGRDSSPPNGVTETSNVVFLPSESFCILPSIKDAKDFVVAGGLLVSFTETASVRLAVIVLKLMVRLPRFQVYSFKWNCIPSSSDIKTNSAIYITLIGFKHIAIVTIIVQQSENVLTDHLFNYGRNKIETIHFGAIAKLRKRSEEEQEMERVLEMETGGGNDDKSERTSDFLERRNPEELFHGARCNEASYGVARKQVFSFFLFNAAQESQHKIHTYAPSSTEPMMFHSCKELVRVLESDFLPTLQNKNANDLEKETLRNDSFKKIALLRPILRFIQFKLRQEQFLEKVKHIQEA